jgi:pyrroline-5-carboxylate reductase
MKTIGFIGGGRITRIFLHAFENAKLVFGKGLVYDVNEQAVADLKIRFENITIAGNISEFADCELVILAIHPPVVMEVLNGIKEVIKPDTAVLSLAPKFNIEKIQGVLSGMKNVARMNPSASTIINRGVNPMAFAPSFDPTKKAELQEMMKHLGYTPEINDSNIEAYAVITAMGHTYFNFQLEKLRELGVSFGLDENEAGKAITNMLWGTTETLFNSGMTYEEVDDLVPVKPLKEVEETIKGFYDKYIGEIYQKIKPV